MNPSVSRITQRIIERSRKHVIAILNVSMRPVARRCIVLNWHAATWRTVLLPASRMINPR